MRIVFIHPNYHSGGAEIAGNWPPAWVAYLAGSLKRAGFQDIHFLDAMTYHLGPEVLRAKLAEVKTQLRRRMHDPIPVQGRWLARVLQGHVAYYAVPGNSKAVSAFRYQVSLHWQRTLRRRSQRGRITWARMGRYATRWLPQVRVMHPYPNVRFAART